MKVYEDIVQTINSFPALSDIISDILEICNNQDSTASDLAKVIQKDQGLMIDILRIVNSPIYGFSREIISVQQAISLFGMSAIKGFVISSVLRQSITYNLSPYGIKIDDYLDTCSHCHTFVMNTFRNESNKVKEIIFPASFLMQAGTLIISNQIYKTRQPNEFTKIITKADDIIQTEIELLGISSTDVTAMLFEHWNFEIDLTDAIKNISKEIKNNKQILSLRLKAALKCINFYKKYTKEQVYNTRQFIQDSVMGIDLTTFDNFVCEQSKRNYENDRSIYM